MCSLLRSDVLSAIAAWTTRHDGCTPDEAIFEVNFGGGSLCYRYERRELTGASAAAATAARAAHPMCQPNSPPPEGIASSASWLSPLEEKIVQALTGRDDYVPMKTLAKLVGETETGDLRAIARNLARRGILQSQPGAEGGYRLKPPIEQA